MAKKKFGTVAKEVSRFTGSATCFAIAGGSVLVWALAGPVLGFSDSWQMVMTTGTTIITFLMVFLIQSSQNRDTETIHIKLDELIRATHGAQNALLDLDDLEQKDLEKVRTKYKELGERAKNASDHHVSPVGTPHVALDGLPPTDPDHGKQ